MKKIYVYSMLIIILFMSSVLHAREPGNPSKVYFRSTPTVKDENGNRLSGVFVLMSVRVLLLCCNQTEFKFASGYTGSNGMVTLEVSWFAIDSPILNNIDTDVSSDYLTLQNNFDPEYITSHAYPEFVVTPNLDEDGNGIFDPYELQLAEKFVPSMVPHSNNKWLVPERADIMADLSNLYIAIWDNGGGGVKGDFLESNVGNLEFPGGEYYGFPFFEDSNYTWFDNNDSDDYTRNVSARINGNLVFEDPPGPWESSILMIHYEWAGLNGSTPSSWNSAYQPERQSNNFPHTVYAHLFLNNVSNVVIQYWFFYPYNDWINNHEGDWEHINVIIDSQVPSVASIIEVDFYFHKKVQTRTSGDFTTEGSTHPVVYIGGKNALYSGVVSGGSYPEVGNWSNVALTFNEEVAGLGPKVSYSEYIDGNINDNKGIIILPEIDDIDYDSNPDMSWFKANFAWGAIESASPGDWQPFKDVQNHPPTGPAQNPGWNVRGEISGKFDNYTSRP